MTWRELCWWAFAMALIATLAICVAGFAFEMFVRCRVLFLSELRRFSGIPPPEDDDPASKPKHMEDQ